MAARPTPIPRPWPSRAMTLTGAYRRLEGRVPYRHVTPPEGVTLRALADTPHAARLEALRTYEDRIGHHAVHEDAARDGAGDFDAHVSVIALDDQGRGIGVRRGN